MLLMSWFRKTTYLAVLILAAGFITGLRSSPVTTPNASPTFTPEAIAPVASDEYIVLSWNDLGMHCYNRDFSTLPSYRPTTTSGRK